MITKDRKEHMFGVAEFLQRYAQEQKLSQQECEELYTLGLLHDIGYAFLDEPDYLKHGTVGGLFLKKQQYKYWQEVYYHGILNCPYQSQFLDLLNWADMHIDSKGNVVSYDERLADIAHRYQTSSITFKNANQLLAELKAKGYK